MNGENKHHEPELAPEEREALRWVGSTPVPVASIEARERARSAFLTGTLPEKRSFRPLRPLIPLALAASLAGAFFFGSQSTDSWTVLAGGGNTAIHVDGNPLRAGEGFVSGTGRTSGDTELDVQLGTKLHCLVAPGSRVEFPRGPGRWLGHTRTLRVEEGEIFVTTGGRKLGFELIVETPETRTRILGTTFAVRCNELGTCVCLYSGEVEVVSPDGMRRVGVPPTMRVQFYQDDREPTLEPMSERERRKLELLSLAGMVDAPALP